MQKVLVVDDEPISRDATAMIIKKYLPDLEVADTCRSGKDAIEKNYYHRPDIMIMDINMPGINGLDAMKQIRQVNKEVCFVVLSAFDYFDYAKEAMEIGVEAYMLKPVKKQEFIDTLKKVMEQVEEKRKNMLRKIEYQEKHKRILPVLENNFINAVCLYAGDTELVREQYELIEKDVESGYIMVVEIRESKLSTDRRVFDMKFEAPDRRKNQDDGLYKYCKSVINHLCDCVVGPLVSKRMLVYVCDSSMCDMSLPMRKRSAYALADKIASKISKEQGEVLIGIGSFHETLEGVKESFNEAHNAIGNIIQNNLTQKIMHIEDIIVSESENEKKDRPSHDKMFNVEVCIPLANEDNAQAQIGFERMFLNMTSQNMELNKLKNILIGYVIELNKKYQSHNTEYYDIMGQILKSINEKVLCGMVKKYIGELTARQVTLDKHKKALLTIEKIDKYIEEHYREDITLEDVARLVNFSSYYLSRFYKNETGINFSDKIMHVRISKAKELFLNSEGNVKDVTYMVGYSDPNYFSKIFKRVTGSTVSEFKKNNGL